MPYTRAISNKVMSANVQGPAEAARHKILDDMAAAKFRDAELQRRVAFSNAKAPRQDDVLWCSLVADGVFHAKQLSEAEHDLNNLR